MNQSEKKNNELVNQLVISSIKDITSLVKTEITPLNMQLAFKDLSSRFIFILKRVTLSFVISDGRCPLKLNNFI